MSAPSEGIKDLMVAGSLGVFAADTGWAIRISRQKDSPDSLITIYDTAGLVPEPGLDINRPGIQVVIRGDQNGYVACYAKCEQIRDLLLGLPSQTINGDLWASVVMTSDIISLGYDEKDRPEFSLNFQLIIHQGDLSGSHRDST